MRIMKEIIDKLKKLNVKKVFVQFPEGLKLKIQEIAKELEKEGFKVILCLEKTYGACDLRDEEAKRLKCDAILHIGHSNFGVKSELPVIYWDYFFDINPLPILEKEFEKINNYKRIGLVTSLQFVKSLEKVKEFLGKRGKEVFVSKSLKYEGQILGCNLSAAKNIEDKVDCFLCISAGKFYPLGLALETSKKVFNLDLEKNEIYSMNKLKYKLQKIIEWNKLQFENAKKIGILVSWKKGQINENIFEIKKRLEKRGKEVFILAMDEITPEKLEGLKVDFLINCACPRIGIDDLNKFKIPLINFSEINRNI